MTFESSRLPVDLTCLDAANSLKTPTRVAVQALKPIAELILADSGRTNVGDSYHGGSQ